MKHTIRMIAIGSCLAFVQPVFAQGIPVIDAASLAQAVKQVESWQAQLQAMSKQYNQALKHFETLTGNRGFGDLLNDAGLQDYVPKDLGKTYQMLRESGQLTMSVGAKTMQQANAIYDCAKAPDVAKCQTAYGKVFQETDNFQKAYDKAQDQTKQVQDLIKQISRTEDPKSIAELQARLQGEQAQLQNTSNQIRLMSLLAQQQDKITSQQQREAFLKNLDTPNKGLSQMKPVTYQ